MHRLKNDGIPKIFTELIKNAKTEIIFFLFNYNKYCFFTILR